MSEDEWLRCIVPTAMLKGSLPRSPVSRVTGAPCHSVLLPFRVKATFMRRRSKAGDAAR